MKWIDVLQIYELQFTMLISYLYSLLMIFLSIFLYLSTGFSTDGEFNLLRTKGSERPVSIVQLKTDAHNEARSMSVRRIEQFLWPVVGRFLSIKSCDVLYYIDNNLYYLEVDLHNIHLYHIWSNSVQDLKQFISIQDVNL